MIQSLLKMIAEGFKKVRCVVHLSKALCSSELDFHREWCWTFTGNAELSSYREHRTHTELDWLEHPLEPSTIVTAFGQNKHGKEYHFLWGSEYASVPSGLKSKICQNTELSDAKDTHRAIGKQFCSQSYCNEYHHNQDVLHVFLFDRLVQWCDQGVYTCIIFYHPTPLKCEIKGEYHV